VEQDVKPKQMPERFRLLLVPKVFAGAFPGAVPRALGGLWIAGVIGGSWMGHLAWLLSTPGVSAVGAIALGHILLQTFLNTGLFVTVHDAIHGLVAPGHPKINRAIGLCFATAYAGLSYGQLAQNHWLHHSAPMAASDPDAYPVECPRFWPWYFKFLGEYWGIPQLLKLAFLLLIFIFVGRVSPLNLTIFWAIPLCLSSLQLFYFGTYQPHQGGEQQAGSARCAKSLARPWLISLVACYHFGYHQEHHDHLGVPWWALPGLYRSLQSQNEPLDRKAQMQGPCFVPST
jgi:beta-carotene/zeaxanthin 4-ketolase